MTEAGVGGTMSSEALTVRVFNGIGAVPGASARKWVELGGFKGYLPEELDV